MFKCLNSQENRERSKGEMCILFVYNNPSPVTGKYRLILATNRDEHFIRNAQPAKKWSEDPVIISGKYF